MIEQQKVVAIDINRQNGASLISIPAYGWRPIKKNSKLYIGYSKGNR